MADYAELSRVSTRRSSNCSLPTDWKALMQILVILAVVAFALAGCNANQTLNPSRQGASGDVYDHYDPIHYAQTSGFYAGR
jgi:hypothetical protein